MCAPRPFRALDHACTRELVRPLGVPFPYDLERPARPRRPYVRPSQQLKIRVPRRAADTEAAGEAEATRRECRVLPVEPAAVPRVVTRRARDAAGVGDGADAEVSALLAELRAGRREAFDEILPLVYHELRRTARRELAVRPSDTLSSIALVHELYLKFTRVHDAEWQDRAHFLGVAAVAMRHILVDRARRRMAGKRGGAERSVSLDEVVVPAEEQAGSLLELHEALDALAILDARLARVVECRFFGGMTETETAEALGVNERTVRRDWVKARGLLYRLLEEGAPYALPSAPRASAP
jgi:RNA polymerase sigma factor (TIGR02999 family)